MPYQKKDQAGKIIGETPFIQVKMAQYLCLMSFFIGFIMDVQDPAYYRHKVYNIYKALLQSWNDKNPAVFSSLFTATGNVIGFDGSQLNGTAAIQRELETVFANHPTARYVGIVREIRAISQDVFLLRAVAGMVSPGQSAINPAVNAVQSLLVSGAGDNLWIDFFQNTPAAFHGRPEQAQELTAELQKAYEGEGISMHQLKFQPVYLHQFLKADDKKVFDAWTKPEIMKQWLFKSDSNKIIDPEIDLRVGGSFSIVEVTANGDKIDHYGKYLQIEKPRKLAFTLEVPAHFPGVTNVIVNIEPAAGGAELSFHQTGVDPDVVKNAWADMFNKLRTILK